ncbi:MAG: alpha/beta hydrolase [Ruminococcaceae bacterium]|nr:alpha/beta hydrolase [Oscillospiraceae bacterium]
MKLKTKISLVTLGGTALFAGTSYMAFKSLLDRTYETPRFLKEVFHKPSKNKKIHDNDERELWFNEQQFTEYEIENAEGKIVKGYFLPAKKTSDVYVFCAPGFKTDAKRQFRFIAKYFHDKNINIFMIDHRASGESDGRYISFGMYEYYDAMQWLYFMKETFGNDIKIILYGVSMGAATVNNMCGDASLPENVKFVISDCSFTSPWELFRYSLKNAHWPVFPLLQGVNMYNRIFNRFSFKDCNTPIESVKYMKLPVLFIHGKRDNFVPWQMVNKLYDECSSPDKELFIVEDAPHCACYLKAPEEYEAKINKLIEKYI